MVAAFAPGTVGHDRGEAEGLAAVFGGLDVPVMAIKGQLGCCGAGAGALDLIGGILAMDSGYVPGAVNCQEVDKQCPINVVRQGREQEINTLVSVGYSVIGGQVAALVITKD